MEILIYTLTITAIILVILAANPLVHDETQTAWMYCNKRLVSSRIQFYDRLSHQISYKIFSYKSCDGNEFTLCKIFIDRFPIRSNQVDEISEKTLDTRFCQNDIDTEPVIHEGDTFLYKLPYNYTILKRTSKMDFHKMRPCSDTNIIRAGWDTTIIITNSTMDNQGLYEYDVISFDGDSFKLRINLKVVPKPSHTEQNQKVNKMTTELPMHDKTDDFKKTKLLPDNEKEDKLERSLPPNDNRVDLKSMTQLPMDDYNLVEKNINPSIFRCEDSKDTWRLPVAVVVTATVVTAINMIVWRCLKRRGVKEPCVVTNQESHHYEEIQYRTGRDVSQRPEHPLPTEAFEENRPQYHYNEPYEWRRHMFVKKEQRNVITLACRKPSSNGQHRGAFERCEARLPMRPESNDVQRTACP